MYFEIEGSSVRLGETMHGVPEGLTLVRWLRDSIKRTRLIHLELDARATLLDVLHLLAQLLDQYLHVDRGAGGLKVLRLG